MNEFMDEEFGVDLSDIVSEDDGNQTEEETSEEVAEESETTQEPEDTEPEEQEKPDEKPEEAAQEELFDLKFNKEIRQVNRQQVTELAQKGLNHDRILEQRDHLQQENAELLKFKQDNEAIISLLDAAAQESGTDRNTFLQSVRENAYVSQGLSRDAAHERVLREEGAGEVFARDRVGLVRVHLDLLQDDAALARELGVGDRRVYVHVRDHVHRRREAVVGHLGEEARPLLGGVGVEVPALPLDRRRDVKGAARLGTLEEHVLDEVGDAREVGRLMAGPACDEEAERDALDVVVGDEDELESVFQDLQRGFWQHGALP